MIRSFNALQGWRVVASDGEVGTLAISTSTTSTGKSAISSSAPADGSVGGAVWGWGPLPTSRIDPRVREELITREVKERASVVQTGADEHLRSAKEVIGYHVEARDGPIGHIEDFLFDEDSWTVSYVAMTTRNWLPGKHVAIQPRHFTEVRWAERRILADLTREEIRDGTPFNAVASHEQTRLRQGTNSRSGEASTPRGR